MPEGPEVKYLTDFLNNNLKDKILNKITINGGRYKKHGPPKNFKKLVDKLPLKIKSVNCYGKFIWWEFENFDLTLWNTLGMSGWWTFDNEKHNNVSFKLKNDTIHFNDVRNFGTIIICDRESLNKKLDKFGPDILTTDNLENKFIERIHKKRNDMLIASALLDQSVASGCGNYLRAEVLYLSKISPFRELKDLTDDELKRIWNILRQLGYNYYNKRLGKKLGIIDGKYKFAESYKRQFLIYMQETDVNGNKTKKEKIKDRTIHYIPKIQK